MQILCNKAKTILYNYMYISTLNTHVPTRTSYYRVIKVKKSPGKGWLVFLVGQNRSLPCNFE